MAAALPRRRLRGIAFMEHRPVVLAYLTSVGGTQAVGVGRLAQVLREQRLRRLHQALGLADERGRARAPGGARVLVLLALGRLARDARHLA